MTGRFPRRARGNQLKALPENIIQLTKLEELDVRDNLLKQIPAALAALPLKALRLCGLPFFVVVSMPAEKLMVGLMSRMVEPT